MPTVMNTIRIRNWEHLERVLRVDFGRTHFIFRGVRSVDHKLRPKIGRLAQGAQRYTLAREKGLLRLFRQLGAIHLQHIPTTDWDWLALAQHHGLPTRLLDWTFVPFVAAWFALDGRFHDAPRKYRGSKLKTQPKPATAAAIYVCRMPPWVDVSRVTDPFAVSQVVSFLPTHVSRRVTAQAGLFTAHPKPHQDWIDGQVTILLLDFDELQWREATKALMRFGVHRYSVYPDLDGLTGHLTTLYARAFNITYGEAAPLMPDNDSDVIEG